MQIPKVCDATVADSPQLLAVEKNGRFPVVGPIPPEFSVSAMLLSTVVYAISVSLLRNRPIYNVGCERRSSRCEHYRNRKKVSKPAGNLCIQHLSCFHMFQRPRTHMLPSAASFPFLWLCTQPWGPAERCCSSDRQHLHNGVLTGAPYTRSRNAFCCTYAG